MTHAFFNIIYGNVSAAIRHNAMIIVLAPLAFGLLAEDLTRIILVHLNVKTKLSLIEKTIKSIS